MDSPRVSLGIDRLLQALRSESKTLARPEDADLHDVADRIRHGARCGMITNPSAVTSDLADPVSALHGSGAHITALFGPEHGARGAAAAGEKVGSSVDRLTGLPVYSLYGPTAKPTPEMLRDIDLLIYDLQDVGVRFFTYTWTLSYLLEAAADAGIPVAVLDRPNPLGGEIAAGPLLQTGLESFVGRYPIPVRHGLTIGELARYFVAHYSPKAQVLVVPVSGWKRHDEWPATGLDWASPSPNLPTWESAAIYPGTCLLEGTNVSEGRGTPLPFRSFGAPWIEPERLVERLSRLPGGRWRGHYFVPSQSKHMGLVCGGVQWYPPRNPNWEHTFDPVLLGLQIVATIRELWPGRFEWLTASNGSSHFDRLIGRRDVRDRIERGDAPEAIAADWPQEAGRFHHSVEKIYS